MPFLLKDETAQTNILYFDNNGQAGIMGTSNAGQALSFQGLGIIDSDVMISPGLAVPGSPSPLTGAVLIPVGGSANVAYSVPQLPTVSASIDPTSVTTTSATFVNSTSTPAVVTYKIW